MPQDTLRLVYLEKEQVQAENQSTKLEEKVQEEVMSAKGLLGLLTKLTSYQIENFILNGFMEKLRKNA